MTNTIERLNDKSRLERSVTSLIIIAFLAAVWTGCVGPKKPRAPHIVGKISGDSYTSPRGGFEVPFPVSPEVGGGVARDDDQSVTFHDNWGSRVSYYSRPFTAESPMNKTLETQGRQKALQIFMTDIYGDAIVPHYHPEVLGGAISFIHLKAVGPKVGVAACIHDNRVYLVETDLLPGVELLGKDDEASQQARSEWLEKRAMQLLQSMTFK